MADEILVRAIRRDDYEQWLPLWRGYNAFYGRHDETALPPHVTAATWQRFFDAYEPVWALVAERVGGRDGQLLGLVHYLFHRVTNRVEPVCYLEDLFTAEAARGAGVGRALIAAVYERAQAAGVTRVYWQTQESNATARRLYDRMAEKTAFIVYAKEV